MAKYFFVIETPIRTVQSIPVECTPEEREEKLNLFKEHLKDITHISFREKGCDIDTETILPKQLLQNSIIRLVKAVEE